LGNGEAPLIAKALRIVSLALIISTVALVAAVGYSAYQEYSAISKLAGSDFNSLNESFNGSNFTLSGLVIPNNMSFPLTVDLKGNFSLLGYEIGTFDSGSQTIAPGGQAALSLSAPLNFLALLQVKNNLQQILLSPTEITIGTTISAYAQPLIGMNITKSTTVTLPAVLSNFSASIDSGGATLSSNHQYLIVPVSLGWNNLTPITLVGGMNLTLTQIPGKQAGNYGTGGGQLLLVSGPNQETYSLSIPVSDLSGGSLPSGAYTLNISLNVFGQTVTFPETVNV
jgi:hypothetical protein